MRTVAPLHRCTVAPLHRRPSTDPFGAKLVAKAADDAQLGVVVPADPAEVALFVAGPSSARMTGQLLSFSVNGGIVGGVMSADTICTTIERARRELRWTRADL